MDSKAHWDNLYSTEHPEQLGWYEPHLRISLEMIAATQLGKDARIIDIGGGASTLVDDLLNLGFVNITVLDFSEAALSLSRARLGARASGIRWLNADFTSIQFPLSSYDLWHDRAVFHFLTDVEERRKCVKTMRDSIRPGGHIVIGTFSFQAPPKCSGLEVQRYSPELLHQELGEDLELQEQRFELHVTPGGVEQMYLYCRFQQPL